MRTFVVFAAAILAGSLGTGFAARASLIGGARGRQTSGRPVLSLPRRRGAVGLALIRADRAVAGLAIWLMLVDAGLALAAPWPLKVVIDYGLGHGRLPPWLGALRGMSPVALAVAAAAAGVTMLALNGLAGYLVTVLSAAIGERLGSRLRVGVLSHLLRAVPPATAKFPLGELASRLGSDAARVSDTVLAVLETLIPDLAVLCGMTVVTALLDWRLTLIALGIIPLYVLIARLRNGGLRPAQEDARAHAGKLSALCADILARLPAIHVFGRASTEVAAYRQASAAAADAAVSALDASARFGPLTDTLPGLGLAVALIAGTVEISARRLSVGGLLVFLAYLSSLTGPVRSLAQLSTTITRGEVSRGRLSELLSLPLLTPKPRSAQLPAVLPATCVHAARSGAAVEISSVCYSHHPGPPALNAVTLRVGAGEFVCITGPSGAGKSTLLALMVRLAEPDSGTICIDGHDIASLPLTRLRRLVTLVPQDPWLTSASIASNIGYGNPAASRAQIEAAADLAGVLTFARELPGGLDAEIGEHGRRLSGGQQRRVAVARAIAADTPVLLLDEPTTGLDQAAEERLIGGLMEISNGKTVVLVTHARRLAALADRVLRLESGRLHETMLESQLGVAASAPGC